MHDMLRRNHPATNIHERHQRYQATADVESPATKLPKIPAAHHQCHRFSARRRLTNAHSSAFTGVIGCRASLRQGGTLAKFRGPLQVCESGIRGESVVDRNWPPAASDSTAVVPGAHVATQRGSNHFRVYRAVAAVIRRSTCAIAGPPVPLLGIRRSVSISEGASMVVLVPRSMMPCSVSVLSGRKFARAGAER